LISWSLAVALGAEITEMPPKLRGDVEISDTHRIVSAGIAEGGEDVGRMLSSRNDLRFEGEFAPIAGVAVRLAIPLSPGMGVSWTDARQMAFDPITGSGSYLRSGPATGDVGFRAGGLTGIELGAAFSPFSERFARPDRVTWRLDLGVRLPTKCSLWTANAGKRGAGNGGTAVLLGGAFSTRRGLAEPYVGADAVLEQPVTVAVVDESGAAWGEQRFHPASTVDVTGGVELRMGENKDRHTRSAFDLHVGFRYRDYGDIASGVWLPTVLDSSRKIVVTQEDGLAARAGLGVIADVHEYFGFRIGVEGAYTLPYTVEHVYAVSTTGDSYEVAVSVGLEGRIR
jgi:hypothetical protein